MGLAILVNRRGVIADGEVDEKEAIFIGQWIEKHREVADRWPVNVLYARVTEFLKDGILQQDEQNELLATLRDLTGDTSLFQEGSKSTSLPINKPEPDLVFEALLIGSGRPLASS